MMLDTGPSNTVWAVAFHPDGVHLLSGSSDGMRRWRLVDGQEVGKQGMYPTTAISVSRDGKWIVCVTTTGASVWDEKIQEKAIEVDGTQNVDAVDISPDAARFATGGIDTASIWNIVTGERLVGPLQHHYGVAGVKFSPNGDHVATACEDSIRVFDSRNGDQLITINADLDVHSRPITPLGWSNNGQQIFAAFHNNKIKAFEASTGSLLAESRVRSLHTGDDSEFRRCIAVAANGTFLATFAPNAISFWDASTLARIGPVIEESQKLRSIALSADCSYVATGRNDGKITIRNLGDIAFEAPCAEEYHDTVESSSGVPMVKRWLQAVIRRGNKNQCLHQPDRLSREPGQPTHPRSCSNSQVIGNTENEGPSRIAASVSRVGTLFFSRQTVCAMCLTNHLR